MSDFKLDTDGTMRTLAKIVDSAIPDSHGFMILVFPFGATPDKPLPAHYIGSGQRETMIKALREKADTLEAGLDIPNVPGAEVQ